MPNDFGLPQGFNTPDLFRMGGKALAEATEDGWCERCGREIDGQQRYYAKRRHGQELCTKCAYRASRGTLDEPDIINPDTALDIFGNDKDPLPF